jgi:hypothetical protein
MPAGDPDPSWTGSPPDDESKTEIIMEQKNFRHPSVSTVTVFQLASLLRVKPGRIREWRRRGILPQGAQTGSRILFTKRELAKTIWANLVKECPSVAFDDLVETKASVSGIPREAAVSAVAKSHPELHKKCLAVKDELERHSRWEEIWNPAYTVFGKIWRRLRKVGLADLAECD